MKNIILIITILAVFSCKKKEVEPIVTTEQPVCKTYDPSLVGKYKIQGGNDTIIFYFVKNNCPTDSRNIYIIKKLGQAVKFDVTTGEFFSIKDYYLEMDEITDRGDCGDGRFEITRQPYNLTLTCSKLNHSEILIKL